MNYNPAPLVKTLKCQTINGTVNNKFGVKLKDIVLPKFNSNLIVDKHTAMVFDTPCNYDIILGWDFIQGLGITIDYTKREIIWRDRTALLKENKYSLPHQIFSKRKDDYFFKINDCFIMEAHYNTTTSKEVAQGKNYLSQSQHDKYETFFLNI